MTIQQLIESFSNFTKRRAKGDADMAAKYLKYVSKRALWLEKQEKIQINEVTELKEKLAKKGEKLKSMEKDLKAAQKKIKMLQEETEIEREWQQDKREMEKKLTSLEKRSKIQKTGCGYKQTLCILNEKGQKKTYSWYTSWKRRRRKLKT